MQVLSLFHAGFAYAFARLKNAEIRARSACGHSLRFLENIGTKMEDRGSNEIEQRIEDEGKRISQGGHNKEGARRESKNHKRRLKTSETVTLPGKLLIYKLTTMNISILISVTGLKTLL